MKPFRSFLLSPDTRTYLSIIVMLVCLFFVSIGSMQAQGNASREATPDAAKSKMKKFRMDFVPENALGVITIRPTQLLAEQAMQPVLQLIKQEQQKDPKFSFLGMDPTKLEIVTIIYLLPDPGKTRRKLVDFVTVLQSTQKIDRKMVRDKFSKSELIESNYKGKSFLTNTSPDGDTLLFLDEKSIIVSDKASAMKKVIDSMQDQSKNVWIERLQSVETASIAGAVDLRLARRLVGDQVVQSLAKKIPVWPLISPVWDHSEIAALGITLKQKLSLELAFVQDKNSQEIRQALQGLLGLGQKMLQQLKVAGVQANRPVGPEQESQIKLVEQVLGSIRVTQNENLVKLSTSVSDNSYVKMMTAVLPGILQAREAARRSRSKVNIKRIMLALHNYHFDHKRFPPAVVMGPDGKTPHSWRVELLPYLDQQALYDKYRMNEPWDSEHNRKIAETIVPVFNNPNSDKSTNASYFVVVGQDTAFGNKTGVSFNEISDGTSNTIAVVEAKRNIPWTKPEDLTFNGKQVPAFGGFHKGGYFVGLCDGKVEFFSELTAKNHLKNLLLIKDGQPAP